MGVRQPLSPATSSAFTYTGLKSQVKQANNPGDFSSKLREHPKLPKHTLQLLLDRQTQLFSKSRFVCLKLGKISIYNIQKQRIIYG
ncbi:Plasma Membrane Calcium-Transporting Atpase 1 [Manis pentadactyla]|nr:Plasma Membrane Calcium-Transporting Atpase 1 [Manis pentadactyla]